MRPSFVSTKGETTGETRELLRGTHFPFFLLFLLFRTRVVSAIGGGRSTLAIDKKTGTANGKGERLLEIKPKV
jgi:hypothetical protein